MTFNAGLTKEGVVRHGFDETVRKGLLPRVFSAGDDLQRTMKKENDENEEVGLRTMLREMYHRRAKLASDKRWVYYWDMRKTMEEKANLTMVYGEDGMLTRVDRTGLP